jgi:hypothetical protein
MMHVSRFAHAIFCDDIRREAQGKVSLIGVIDTGKLIIHGDFPVTLPKLCVYLTVNTPIEQPFNTLSLTLAGPPMADKEISTEIPINPNRPPAPEGTVAAGVHSGLEIEFFQFHAPGIIEAVVLADGERYLAGRLRVIGAAKAEG